MSVASGIEVRVLRPPLLDLAGEWNDLASSASPNVFMHPAAINAAHETGFARIHVLVARQHGNDGQDARLVGIWALEEQRVFPFGPRYLAALPHRYAFLGSPAVARGCAREVIAAMLATLTTDRSLPKALLARYLDGDPEISDALAAGGHVRRRIVFNERTRAFFTPEAGAKRSGSTRKKLRQDWNRLATAGAVAIINDREPDAVRAAFEIFLAMEAASWKGEAGTALLSDPADARFARRMIAGYADCGNGSIALLTVDGKPIAAQVVLMSGAHAYTWKIAYDQAYQRYSPGSLLVDRLSEMLVADGFTAIDSCSPEGGFMNTLWSGRQSTIDAILEIGPHPTLTFPLLAAKTLARAFLKRRWLALRDAMNRRAAKSATAAPPISS